MNSFFDVTGGVSEGATASNQSLRSLLKCIFISVYLLKIEKNGEVYIKVTKGQNAGPYLNFSSHVIWPAIGVSKGNP